MSIQEYLDSIKERLVTAPIVASFQIIRERTTSLDGHLRARLVFSDSSQLEFSEYVQRSSDEVEVVTYSYHWTDANAGLIQRWDNAPHHPELPGFPHHIHQRPTSEATSGQPTSIFAVLDEIGATLSSRKATG